MVSYMHMQRHMTLRTSRFRIFVAERGLTLVEIQKRTGLSATTVAGCSRGMVPGQAARERIARALDAPEADIWPITGSIPRSAHG